MSENIINYLNGNKFWYKNGRLHREDGPAVEYPNGYKEWYFEGEWHRLDGPAIETSDGHKEWYYQGKHIECSSQEEFEKIIKLKAFWV